MNRVLVEVSKAIESGTIDPETTSIVLQFIVEKRRRVNGCRDEHVALAEIIRRALVDADSPNDLESALEILDGMRPQEKP